MTYADLLAALKELTPEQLEMDVTIQTPDGEFFRAFTDMTPEDDDVLGSNHPFLKIDGEV
jgi:hypothetical protein